jgi:hypothetical protein
MEGQTKLKNQKFRAFKWNQSVQQGRVAYDCGLYIMKIMGCLVTRKPLDFTQEGVYRQAPVKESWHLCPDRFR